MKLNKKVTKSIIAMVSMIGAWPWVANAMPTGGEVVSGNVSNVENPVNIMQANADSVINWNTFDIGTREQVTFDSQNYTILNKVISGQESKILGSLHDKGSGKIIVVNPNGIIIGKDAVINVNNITLSALEMAQQSNQDGYDFVVREGSKAKITVEKGSVLNVGELLNMYGGIIEIADGVEIIPNTVGVGNVEIVAAGSVSSDYKGILKVKTKNNFDIDINNSIIGSQERPLNNVRIMGNKICLSDVDIFARYQEGNPDNYNSNDVAIFGGSINMDSCNVYNQTGPVFVAAMATGSDYNIEYRKKDDAKYSRMHWILEMDSNPKNKVSLNKSTVVSENANLFMYGGEIVLNNSGLSSGDFMKVNTICYIRNGGAYLDLGKTGAITVDNYTLENSEYASEYDMRSGYGFLWGEPHEFIIRKKNNHEVATYFYRIPKDSMGYNNRLKADGLTSIFGKEVAYLLCDNLSAKEVKILNEVMKRGDVLTEEEKYILNKVDMIRIREEEKIIAAFENANPDIKAVFDRFLGSGKYNDLTDEEVREIKYRAYSAKEPARTVFLRFLNKQKLRTTDTNTKAFGGDAGSAFYQGFRHDISLRREDAKNAESDSYAGTRDDRYDYHTIYHEAGHSIDDQADLNGWTNGITNNGHDTYYYKAYSESAERELNVYEAVMYDVYDNVNNPHSLINYYKNHKTEEMGTYDDFKQYVRDGSVKGDVIRGYRSFLYDDTYNDIGTNDMMSVKDIYGGATRNNFGYGHENDYWEMDGNIQSEAWAEYFEGYFIQDEKYLAKFEEYLPTTSEVLRNYLVDLSKKVKPIIDPTVVN